MSNPILAFAIGEEEEDLGFNFFVALGLDPAHATIDQVAPAATAALVHRTNAALAQVPTTAHFFPSYDNIQTAARYLGSSQSSFDTIQGYWRQHHTSVFFPHLAIGDPGVFGPGADPDIGLALTSLVTQSTIPQILATHATTAATPPPPTQGPDGPTQVIVGTWVG